MKKIGRTDDETGTFCLSQVVEEMKVPLVRWFFEDEICVGC